MIDPAPAEARLGRMPGDSLQRPPLDKDLLLSDLARIGLGFSRPNVGSEAAVLAEDAPVTIELKEFRDRGADLLERGDLAKAFYVARHQVGLNDLWYNPISPLGDESVAPAMPLLFRSKPSVPEGRERSKVLYSQVGGRYEGKLDKLDMGSLGVYLALINTRVKTLEDIEEGVKSVVEFTNTTRSFAVPVLRMWCTAVLPHIPRKLDKA